MHRKETAKTVLTKGYDLTSGGILRTIRLAVFARFIPVGNLFGGPGVRCLLILFMLHIFGNPLYRLNARYGEKLQGLKRVLTK